MIKIDSQTSRIRVLKAEKAGMFSAKEYNKMYNELQLIYKLLDSAMNKIEDMEKKNDIETSYSKFVNDVKKVLQNLL